MSDETGLDHGTAQQVLAEVQCVVVALQEAALRAEADRPPRLKQSPLLWGNPVRKPLYALAGGPPYRPGLIRNDQGSAIDLEVWALSEQALGSFMRTVPAPLGIGTLTLEDGTQVKGFLCEAIAARDALDITVHGGWRTYLAATAGPSADTEERPTVR